jgi:dolichol-phosphate mannosyltransferase
MAHPPRTLIVFATYNEIENLPRLVTEVMCEAPTADLLVVDDNSPDGTADWCERQRTVDLRLHLLRRARKQGYGSAIVAGMQYAIDHAYDYVVTMDADFSHQPCYLPNIVGGMETAPAVDVMIGSRYVQDGGTKDWPLKRRMMSGAVNRVARLFLHLNVRDCSSGYRCFRVSRLAMLDLGGLLSNGYSFPEEILWRLRRVGATFRETPITFPDRTLGETKMNLREAIGAMRVLVNLGVRNLLNLK